ncbi:MAG: SulP family inorganic anion transporter [Leptospiraceae bacterium]|nr:SulP family inorganic anion transporter [Leptospiraceae bacterium]
MNNNLTFKEVWKDDLLAGLIVFMIALPLSIGIATASGAPPIAGLLAAVVGGMLCGFVSGSHVTINGPAAGLIVVILHSIESLGEGNRVLGFKLTLACIVIAGIIQIIFGILKTGKYAALFPSSVVHGMLSAIGIIIFSKQIHVALGVSPESKSILGQIMEIPHSVMNMNPEIALIGFLALLISSIFPLFKNKYLKMIPAPLLAVILGIVLSFYFDLDHQHPYTFLQHTYSLGPNFLINLPTEFSTAITFPDFSKVLSSKGIIAIISIFFVASLESLLSAVAVDKLDPYQRKSDLNKEFVGKGIANTFLGLIGGLPIIAEIVRSSANIQNNAKTRMANFFHGLFLLIFVLSVPALLHEIPLSALAGILIYVGFKLASPSTFWHTMEIGVDQFIIFGTTVFVTLAEDLLVGVFAGLVMNFIINYFNKLSLKNTFKAEYTKIVNGDAVTFKIKGSLVFSNYYSLDKELEEVLNENKKVVLDFEETQYIDHSIVVKLFELTVLNPNLTLQGIENMQGLSKHPHAAKKKQKVA